MLQGILQTDLVPIAYPACFISCGFSDFEILAHSQPKYKALSTGRAMLIVIAQNSASRGLVHISAQRSESQLGVPDDD